MDLSYKMNRFCETFKSILIHIGPSAISFGLYKRMDLERPVQKKNRFSALEKVRRWST